MNGIVAPLAVPEHGKVLALPVGFVSALLNASKTAIWVTERNGRVLMSNASARQFLGADGPSDSEQVNLFNDLLKVEPNEIAQKIDAGERELEVDVARGEKKTRARIQWIPEPGCL
ncbi:MAG: PAS domain-containing protein, partial [Candidatus Acidiferrum sp.]